MNLTGNPTNKPDLSPLAQSRLRQVAHYVVTNNSQAYQFEMSRIKGNLFDSDGNCCGTSACILGTAIMLFEPQLFSRESFLYKQAIAMRIARQIFEVNDEWTELQLENLFYSCDSIRNVTSKNIKAVIEAFIQGGMDSVYSIFNTKAEL